MIGGSITNVISSNSLDNQITSLAASEAAINSAFVVDKEMHCCSLLFQEIALSAYLRTIPDVDFLLSVSLA